MELCFINHDYRYELEKLVRIFKPFEKINFHYERVETDNSAVTEALEDRVISTLNLEGECYREESPILRVSEDIGKDTELSLALTLFKCWTRATDYMPPWGILTGVRPAKLFSRLSAAYGREYAEEYFKKTLLVHPSKLSLCKSAVEGEGNITSLSRPESFSLYISIPFCPTRCSYCSFVSHSIATAKKLVPEYIRLLCKEIELTALKAKANGLRLETVYIGGGTPTAVSAEELRWVMMAVRDNFDLSHLREWTVEAGRPDTVTKEKLEVIKSCGATRISINPQTMNDNVLAAIGRKHTAKQTVDAFLLARELGFDNINMDLIAGLPTDTLEGFIQTVERVIELSPESVTVHTLSLKRSSTLNTKGELPETERGRIASDMVEYARSRLCEVGIVPYYMYRQSKTVGNLENVGYAVKGAECLYNVYIMDETHTILACGASGVTKLREPGGSYIERIFNFKYPYEYIDRFDELMTRKDGIDGFYSSYGFRDK